MLTQNIVNVGKGDFKLPDDDENERKKQKYLTEMFKPYIEYAKKILFEKVGNVILSNRLSTEPCVVVADSYGQSSFMEKIQKSQMLSTEGQNPTANIKKILEINPNHRVNQILLDKIKVLSMKFRMIRPTRQSNSWWKHFIRQPPCSPVLVSATPMLTASDFTRSIPKPWEF